eukprot:1149206-Pelagomonas_calceolata.AAC.4
MSHSLAKIRIIGESTKELRLNALRSGINSNKSHGQVLIARFQSQVLLETLQIPISYFCFTSCGGGDSRLF